MTKAKRIEQLEREIKYLRAEINEVRLQINSLTPHTNTQATIYPKIMPHLLARPTC